MILAPLLVAGLAVVGQAQPAPVVLPPNTPYTLIWTHDGNLGPTFNEYIDNTLVKTFQPSDLSKSATADGHGDFTYSASGVPIGVPGMHTIVVSATNTCVPAGGSTPTTCEGRSAPAPELTAWTQAPNVPGGVTIKIIIITPAGGSAPVVDVIQQKPGGGGSR